MARVNGGEGNSFTVSLQTFGMPVGSRVRVWAELGGTGVGLITISGVVGSTLSLTAGDWMDFVLDDSSLWWPTAYSGTWYGQNADETIAVGRAVYINGTGGWLHSQADATSAEASFHGFMTSPGSAGTQAWVKSEGRIYIPAALRTGSWVSNERLYVEPTTAKITNVRPTTPGQFVIPVGIAHNNSGLMLIRAGEIVAL